MGPLFRTLFCQHGQGCPQVLTACAQIWMSNGEGGNGTSVAWGFPDQTRGRTGQGIRSKGPVLPRLPWLDCLVQMAGILGGSLVKMSAPNRLRDKTDEHFGATSDSAESWTGI